MSALERAVAAQFERSQTINALAGTDEREVIQPTVRALNTESVRPALMVHSAKTDAPCSVCGGQATQLLRRGTKGPFTTSCSKSACMNTATRNL